MRSFPKPTCRPGKPRHTIGTDSCPNTPGLVAFVNPDAPGRTRTCDLRIRNPLLYPTELRAQDFIIHSYNFRDFPYLFRFDPFFWPLGYIHIYIYRYVFRYVPAVSRIVLIDTRSVAIFPVGGKRKADDSQGDSYLRPAVRLPFGRPVIATNRIPFAGELPPAFAARGA